MEPSRPRLPDRAGPPLLNTAVPRVRIRRRVDTTSDPPPAVPPVVGRAATDGFGWLRLAALAGAFVIAVASRGDVAVLALLLALGGGRRTTAFAASIGLAAAMVRWGSPSLRAIAGAQAVLGPAGWTGSGSAVASAWLAAAALVLAPARPTETSPLVTVSSVAPFAVAAADVVAGPAIGGPVAVRIVASVVAVGIAAVMTRWRRAPFIACGVAGAALVLAGLAR